MTWDNGPWFGGRLRNAAVIGYALVDITAVDQVSH